MMGFDVKAIDVVQGAVIGFAGNGQGPTAYAQVLNHPLDRGISTGTQRVRIGDGNGAIATTGFFYPVAACEFPIAIQTMTACKDRRGQVLLGSG